MKKNGFVRLVLLVFLFFVLVLSLFLVLSRTGFFNKASTGSSIDPKRIKVKVAVVIYNPTFQEHGGKKIIDYYGWSDPVSVTNEMISDLEKSSHGAVDIEVVKTVNQDKFLPHVLGVNELWRYTENYYIEAFEKKQFVSMRGDWLTILSENSLIDPINSGEIDEVWLWGPPEGGFYESTMLGPNPFYINGSPERTDLINRNAIFMGLNYERGIPEALESIAHRAEGMIEYRYGQKNTWGSNAQILTDWDAFNALDMYLPGRGGIGNPHNAFNAEAGTDYNRISKRLIKTSADDWYNFPNMTGAVTEKNCTAWGNCLLGDQSARGYLNWYFDHIPHVSGTKRAYLNNWWRYIFDANQQGVNTAINEESILENGSTFSCISNSNTGCSVSTAFLTIKGARVKVLRVSVPSSAMFSVVIDFPRELDFTVNHAFSYGLYVDGDVDLVNSGSPTIKLKTDDQNYYLYTNINPTKSHSLDWDVTSVAYDNILNYAGTVREVIGAPGRIKKVEIANDMTTVFGFDLYFTGINWANYGLQDKDSPVIQNDFFIPSVLNEATLINPKVNDNLGIDRVEFYVDDKLVDYDSLAPFTYVLDSNRFLPGPHSLMVRAVDFFDNSSFVKALFTAPKSVEADFSMDKSTGQPPLTVKFTNLSNSNNLSGAKYLWDFGDGQTSSEESPTHVFVFPPDKLLTEYDYQVTLTAKNSVDLTTQKSATIHLASVATGILFSPTIKVKPVEGKSPLKVAFVCKLPPGSNPLGLIIGCRWNFGDNSEEVVSEVDKTVFHTFKLSKTQSAKKFKVKMSAFDVSKPEEVVVLNQRISVKK